MNCESRSALAAMSFRFADMCAHTCSRSLITTFLLFLECFVSVPQSSSGLELGSSEAEVTLVSWVFMMTSLDLAAGLPPLALLCLLDMEAV